MGTASLINNRQAGRRRGRGGNNGGGGQRQGNPGRPDTGNRIDSRARGNASQLYEKYKNMAADAQRAGDRVNTEYFLQFADHYFRVLSEQRGRFEEQQPRARSRDDFDFDGPSFEGEEFGDEGEPVRGNEQGDSQRIDMGDERSERQRDDRPNDRQREDRSNDRQRGDRDGGYRREANADGRNGRAQGDWQDRPRRPDAAPAAMPVEVAGQRRADPIAASESLDTRAEEVLEADRPLDAPAARRRGRPRRDAEPTSASESDRVDGSIFDTLPPALTVAANDTVGDGAPAEAKPRRRRARPAEDTPTAAE